MSEFDHDPSVAGATRPTPERLTPEATLGRSRSAADGAPIGSIAAEEIREKSGGSRPISDETDVRLSGGGAVETPDGLDENDEALRAAAEGTIDKPVERLEDVPVFDRGESLDLPRH